MEIQIPEFIPPERIIYIMAGIECIGYIEPHTRKIYVKVSQCSQCGRCCEKLKCESLIEEPGDNDLYICDKGVGRPLICCISEPKNIPECTSKYEMI